MERCCTVVLRKAKKGSVTEEEQWREKGRVGQRVTVRYSGSSKAKGVFAA